MAILVLGWFLAGLVCIKKNIESGKFGFDTVDIILTLLGWLTVMAYIILNKDDEY